MDVHTRTHARTHARTRARAHTHRTVQSLRASSSQVTRIDRVDAGGAGFDRGRPELMATGRFKCKVPRVCLPGCLCGCIPAACMYCRCECMCVCICGCVGIEHEQHLHMQVCNTRQDIAEVLEEVDGDVNVRGRVQELNRQRGHHQAAVVFVCVCVCV